MTVKEAASVLKDAKSFVLGWNGTTIDFAKDNFVMMEAYGDFIVDGIFATGDIDNVCYELNLAMRPVKAGA